MIINDMAQLRSLVNLDGKELYFGGPEGFNTIEEVCYDAFSGHQD